MDQRVCCESEGEVDRRVFLSLSHHTGDLLHPLCSNPIKKEPISRVDIRVGVGTTTVGLIVHHRSQAKYFDE